MHVKGSQIDKDVEKPDIDPRLDFGDEIKIDETIKVAKEDPKPSVK